ncbi:hypothetical protein ABH944_008538 [Caballeronia udeis]|uniref:Uncharacterized protein n=1 Tax=Caballeronia udeis TaxID=1232866 RepID=A0ABW8MXN3_9BURK
MKVMNYYGFMNYDPSKIRSPRTNRGVRLSASHPGHGAPDRPSSWESSDTSVAGKARDTAELALLFKSFQEMMQAERSQRNNLFHCGHVSLRTRVRAREQMADVAKKFGVSLLAPKDHEIWRDIMVHQCLRSPRLDITALWNPNGRPVRHEFEHLRALTGQMVVALMKDPDLLAAFVSNMEDVLAKTWADLDTLQLLGEQEGAPSHQATSTAADPLAAARARGRQFAFTEYEHSDNLPLLDARTYAGRNERSINEARQRGELYALVPPGKTRGFRYPKWQFDAEPHRLIPVLSPFVQTQANCWVVHSFMLGKSGELQGQTPAQVILDPTQDVGPVISMASRQLTEEQGAL